ncbi:MAG: deoxyribose-phosphate aldolase [Firmicutes bacterium]|nr:deoxyribose-phosphate aldolase [Bacillota bacterium]
MTCSVEGIARAIDHTLLKPDAVTGDIVNLCRQARSWNFAAVCVNPCHVPLAARELAGTTVKVCAVAGFPLGANTTAVKAAEVVESLQAGAEEVDVVINIGLLKGGRPDLVRAELDTVIRAAKSAKPEALVKVILETGLLTGAEKVAACRAAVAAGADFVKTCTGFSSGGATPGDVRLLRQTVGERCGVKAAGGIRTLTAAVALLEAGADRLGTSSGVAIMEELVAGQPRG